MADGYLNFDTKINTKGFNSGVHSIGNGLGKVKSALGSIGKLAVTAFSVKALVDFGKKAVGLASDIEEVQNVVDVSFGDMAYKMEHFADSAIQMYGISKLAAKQTGSTFMAMARGMGLASESASDMSLSLTALSADMASFYNKSQDQTATALKSIFTGETETLKQYGIVMTEANLQSYAMTQGINKQISAMTQAEKVQLRYNYVMQQTALAQGDFARTSGSWANQVKLAKMQFEEFASQLGTILKNVLLPALKTINTILGYLIQGATKLVAVFSKLFGWETQTDKSTSSIKDNTSATADNIKDATDNQKKQNKAAEKLLGTYDKLNVIQQDANESADNASSALDSLGNMGGYDITGSFDLDTSKADEKLDNLIERVKKMFDNSDFSELGNTLRDKIVAALDSVDFNTITEKGNKISKSFATFLNGLFEPKDGDFVLGDSIGKFVANALNSATSIINTFVWEIDTENIGANLTSAIQSIFTTLDWGNLTSILSGAMVNGFDFVTGLMEGVDWYSLPKQIGTKLIEAFKGFDFSAVFTSIGKTVGTAAKSAASLFSGIINGIKQGVKTYFQPYIDEAGGNIWAGVLKGITSAIKGIGNWIKTNIFQPFIDGFKKAFGIASPSKKMAEMGGYLIQGLKNGLGNIWNTVKEKFSAFWTKLSDWFSGESGIIGKIKKKGSSIATSLISGIGNLWDKAKNKFNELWTKLSDWLNAHKPSFNFKLPTWSEFKTKLKTFINNIIDYVNTNFIPKLQNLFSLKVPDNKFTQKVLPDYAGKNYNLITIPKIPKLATGTVVPANYGEFLSVLGDNRKAPEIVSPVPEMKNAMREVLNEKGSDSKRPIVIQVGSKEMARVVWDEFRKDYKQTRKGFA